MDATVLILEEVRALRKTLEELKEDSLQRITALEEKTKPLFNNGQLGRCSVHGNRLTSLEHWRIRIVAIAGVVALTVSIIFKGATVLLSLIWKG